MTTKKTKKRVIANVSLEQAQQASEQYAKVSTSLAKIEAKMNEEINRIKSKYQDEVTDLKDELDEPVSVLEQFAKEQQPTWGKLKSTELLHTKIGFRTGTPKVGKTKKGFSWDAVLELMKKNSLYDRFIRVKEEINKDAILAERDELVLEQLKDECYITIEQEESFYVEVLKAEVTA